MTDLLAIRFMQIGDLHVALPDVVDLVNIAAFKKGIILNSITAPEVEVAGIVFIGAPATVAERYENNELRLRSMTIDGSTSDYTYRCERRLIASTIGSTVTGALMPGGEFVILEPRTSGYPDVAPIVSWLRTLTTQEGDAAIGGLLEALHTALTTEVLENDQLRDEIKDLKHRLESLTQEQSIWVRDLERYIGEMEAYASALEQQIQASDKSPERASLLARLIGFVWQSAANRLLELGVEGAVDGVLKRRILQRAIDAVTEAVVA